MASFILLLSCAKDNDTIDDPGIDKSANLLATGDSAHDILANTNYTDLLIEVAYVEGFRPTPVAMDNFVAFLQARTFKQNISIQYLGLPSPGEETLTLQEV
ncbi:MAG: hypothetical protein KJP14_02705, partial [Eudoraea sp.]|nr:hypothetical protein [Eudoraea sp.]